MMCKVIMIVAATAVLFAAVPHVVLHLSRCPKCRTPAT